MIYVRKIVGAVLITITVTVGAVMVLGLIGAAVEGVADWQVEHDRCLKHATNGYEIRRCR